MSRQVQIIFIKKKKHSAAASSEDWLQKSSSRSCPVPDGQLWSKVNLKRVERGSGWPSASPNRKKSLALSWPVQTKLPPEPGSVPTLKPKTHI